MKYGIMNRPHYFYKTPYNGRVGTQLQTFMRKCRDAEEKARLWAEKHGINQYYESPEGMAGGISAVEFENVTSMESWNKITTPDGRVLFLPKEDTDLEKEMCELPVVNEMELITILSLLPKKIKKGLPLPFTFGDTTPIVFCHHGDWYIDVPYMSNDLSIVPISEKEFCYKRMGALKES